mmetsp:Transcript_49333/g.111984  ORF Transcript_49333/g.111984 Transcript_49333/m.111984 type:complete len:82 (-) Transcript_49333:1039-1284(-)
MVSAAGTGATVSRPESTLLGGEAFARSGVQGMGIKVSETSTWGRGRIAPGRVAGWKVSGGLFDGAEVARTLGDLPDAIRDA